MEVRERSVPELVGEIMGDVQRLLRDEVRLARAEVSHSIREAAVGAAGMIAAGILALLGIAFIGVAVFYALFLALPGWAAGLITAAIFFGLAVLAYLVGRSRLKPSELRPDQTIRTLEEDREWLERRAR